MKFTDLTECPYCGSNEFYTKARYSGPIVYFERFNGEKADNSGMYDFLTKITSGNNVWCAVCGEYLGNRGKNRVAAAAEKAMLQHETGRADHGND